MTDMRYIPRVKEKATYPVKKLVNLTKEQAEQISKFRFDQRLQSENEAIRRLIEIGIAKGRLDYPKKRNR